MHVRYAMPATWARFARPTVRAMRAVCYFPVAVEIDGVDIGQWSLWRVYLLKEHPWSLERARGSCQHEAQASYQARVRIPLSPAPHRTRDAQARRSLPALAEAEMTHSYVRRARNAAPRCVAPDT